MSTPGQGEAPRFPFGRLFTLAVVMLHLPPSEFWRMTPRELFALLEHVLPPPPPDRTMLEDLIARYGD